MKLLLFAAGFITGCAFVRSTHRQVRMRIQAMDAESFAEFADKNNKAFGDAVAKHLQNYEGRLSNAIRSLVGS
jgi:hypothetical protein